MEHHLYNQSKFYVLLAQELIAQEKLHQSQIYKVLQLQEQIKEGQLPALIMKEQAGGDSFPPCW